ncbi:g4301 [Coccomyxa elongata]
MGRSTKFVMLRGPMNILLPLLMKVLPTLRVIWSGVGDKVIETSKRLQPKSFKRWDVQLVIDADESALRTFKEQPDIDVYEIEVEPSQWKPSEEELKAAKIVEPWHHPVGLLQVLRRNWHKIFSVYHLLLDLSRLAHILSWAAYHTFIKQDMRKPFHMINFLKFQGNEKTYTLYRDAAGMMILKGGGGLAFMGKVKSPGPCEWDEIMIVAYKDRFQFFLMALLTPTYWPLSLVRDEGLSDSILFAVEPMSLPLQNS